MIIRKKDARASVRKNLQLMLIALARSPQTTQQFSHEIADEWLSNLQDFAHRGLPALLGVVAFAWALIWLVNVVTRRLTTFAESRTTLGAGRASQIKTVVSVLRATAIGSIGFLAALQILSDVFKFSVAPLLTSAGVAGVAIGLAAQTIVKDCLNGMLILIEDQYNVGDAVRLAGLAGTVESMSLRTTMLRDADGTLYTIPNSQITTVANLTRDYSVATINIAVDFSAHPDKVMPVLLQAATSVRSDPAYEHIFLADPKLLGVDSIKGSQVIYAMQIRTLANQQAPALREIQKRVRLALEENGIRPGDPMRAFDPGAVGRPTAEEHHAENRPPAPDPTSAKPRETNPLTGEDS
jgi:small conductance mechanosensitive channel